MTDPTPFRFNQNLPVEDCELGQLFASLEPYDNIAIGVSGGADSMALMHLLARWQRALGDRGERIANILVMTVDHGLRAASRSEAEWVGEQAQLLGFDHITLQWLGRKPETGVQDAARRIRYELMIGASLEADCGALVVAHHAEDQAETLLMRLARGSGLDGLAGMSLVSFRDGIALHRPFLDISKTRLKASLEANDVQWIDDPSNEDSSYERVRLRKVMALLEPLGVSQGALARSASRLIRARQALDGLTRFAIDDLVNCHDGAYGEIDAVGFFALPFEIRLRLVSKMIGGFGGRMRAPQLSKLENALTALDLAAGASETYSGSLGGALVRYDGRRNNDGCIFIFREPNRGDIETLPLKPGREPLMWDKRFWVSLAPDIAAGSDLTIGALGEEGVHFLRKREWKMSDMPREALLALPAFKKRDLIVGVPHLDYWSDEATSLVVTPDAPVKPDSGEEVVADLSARLAVVEFISGNISAG